MKKKTLLTTALSLCLCTALAADLNITTKHTTLLLTATEGEPLKFRYYGDRLSATDADNCQKWWWDAMPTFGTSFNYPSCLQVAHADGNQTTSLEVRSVEQKSVDEGQLTRVTQRDKMYALTVVSCYLAHADVDVIETWTEITNDEKKQIVLGNYDSAFLPIRRGNVWVSHLHGTWADETNITSEPLNDGGLVVSNTDGTRNAHQSHPELMFSLDGEPQENSGRVIGAALCWNGNYKLRVETTDMDYHLFSAGIDSYASAYHLDKGKTLCTPHLALTYSTEGLGGASRNYHDWARDCGKVMHGDRERDILLNSWEGVYFNVNADVMAGMMNDIAALGGELFVMDDGWFGDKYQRNNDSSTLGDWTVDTKKLPDGIEGLLAEAKKAGVKFGIWIEPEFTNTKSELYEKHPDWVLRAGSRPLQLGRGGTQLLLDLCNPKVQDFVFGVVDNLFGKYPDLAYIKWDCNTPLENYGSGYLPQDKQSNIYVDYVNGLEKVLKRIREKYPDRTIQACGSGGGRTNYGFMPYFDEFWVSDNTDALQRIYIQWGTSYFYPAISMAQHVSSSPNHNTGRVIPIKFRFDVAMSGRLGMEMQPKEMSQEEYDFSKEAIKTYKGIRRTVQMGDQYRLVAPMGGSNMASLMYVSKDKQDAVLFAYKLRHMKMKHFPTVRLSGLEADAQYTLHELNVATGDKPCELDGKTFSGRYLMNTGLDVLLSSEKEYSSRVFALSKNK